MIITRETDYALRILRALLDGQLHTVGPVSYTHLDVYKRQVAPFANILGFSHGKFPPVVFCLFNGKPQPR